MEKRMPSHIMELPRQIVLGDKNIYDIGNFLNSLKKTKKVSLISGSNVKKIVQKKKLFTILFLNIHRKPKKSLKTKL